MNIHLAIHDILQKITDFTRCDVDKSFVVHRIASLQNAGPNDIAVILDRGDASVFSQIGKEAIKNCNAGVFLAQHEVVPGKNYLLVPDPLAAFCMLVDLAEQKNNDLRPPAVIADTASVHPSAVIEPGARVGNHATIGAHAFVGSNATIGTHTLLHPGARVLDRCTVGDNSIIHSGAVIGSDGFGYEVSKTGLKKIPQIGIVHIGNNVEIGANCMIDRASFDKTIIGDGVKMDNGVHIAHNVIVGPYSAILAQTGIAGSVHIGMGCQIGGQVAIKDNVKIGNGAKIVSKSAVMNDVAENEIVAGIPAIQFRQWKRLIVSLNKVPEALKMLGNLNVFSGQKKSWWQRLLGW